MRLPFLQVTQDAIARARTMARLLGIPETHGIGIAVALFAWALEVAPAGDYSGQIADGHPEEMVAAAVGWTGDTKALYAALERVGFLDRTNGAVEEGFDRVKGLDRYAKALTNADNRSALAKKAAKARWKHLKQADACGNDADAMRTHALRMPDALPDACASNAHACPPHASGNASAMRDDAKTQTQTHKPLPSEEGAAVATPPAQGEDDSPKPRGEVLELHPTEPPGKKQRRPSFAESLYQRCESSRVEACELAQAEYVPEGWPPARQNAQLGFLSRASPEERSAFEAAWDTYLSTPESAAKDPPYSLGWFLATRSTWESKARRAAAVESLGGVP